MPKLSADSIDNIIRKGNVEHVSHLIKHHDLDDQHLRAIAFTSRDLHRHGHEIIERGFPLSGAVAEQMIYASKSLAQKVLVHPSVQHHKINLSKRYNDNLSIAKKFPSPKGEKWLNT